MCLWQDFYNYLADIDDADCAQCIESTVARLESLYASAQCCHYEPFANSGHIKLWGQRNLGVLSNGYDRRHPAQGDQTPDFEGNRAAKRAASHVGACGSHHAAGFTIGSESRRPRD